MKRIVTPLPTDPYDPACKGCKISQGHKVVPGGVVGLPGEWQLNHYRGTEGFLGWLALQPTAHRMSLAELSQQELCSLGPNLQAVDVALSDYASKAFRDPLKRLYIVYFFESAELHPYHLHIHLIPRYASIEGGLQAWNMPVATKSARFPDRYRRSNPAYSDEVNQLMSFLRERKIGWK